MLVCDPRAERKREHDARNQERLNRHQSPDAEGGGLREVAERVRPQANEPDRLADEAHQKTGPQGVRLVLLHCALLLAHGGDGEEEGGDQSERCGESGHVLLLPR